MISAWFALILAIPVLVLGELLVKRSYLLSRLNVPPAVVGGLLVGLVVLVRNAFSSTPLQFQTDVLDRWWTWLVWAEPDWSPGPATKIVIPFIAIFFTCLGLNASWTTFKRGGITILIFLGLAALLAVIQNGVGIAAAKALHQPLLMGLLCGSLSLTGGLSTTLEFATELDKAGVTDAVNIGLGASAYGVLASAILGGAIGGALIRRRHLHSPASPANQTTLMNTPSDGWLSDLRGIFVYGRPFVTHVMQSMESGVLGDLRALFRYGRPLLLHLLLILACVKLGAWINHYIIALHVNVTVLIGPLFIGLAVRGVMDLCGLKWLREDIVDTVGSIALGLYIVIAMMTFNLGELRYLGGPLLAILILQTVIMVLFAWFVTFQLTGRNYDAAVIAGGHFGVGLGQTSNAVANMKALVDVFGPSPRAFIVVVIGSSFLLKYINALNISWFLKFLH